MDERVPRLVTIFVRCPDPLAFDATGNHVISLPNSSLSGFDDAVLHLSSTGVPEAYLTEAARRHLFVSIRFHQASHPQPAVKFDISEVADVARRVLPKEVLGELDLSSGSETPRYDYSVAEMVVPVVEPIGDGEFVPAEPSDQATGFAMDLALDMLFKIIRAHRFATRTVSGPPTMERLNPTSITATRPAKPENGSWDGQAVFMLVVLAAQRETQRPSPLDAAGMTKFAEYLSLEMIEHPAMAFIELQADALAALRLQGDYRAAVLLAHSAGEVMLDQSLMIMQWEEGLTPAQAMPPYSRSLLSRVREQFHPRIGGAWSTAGRTTVLGRWREDVVLLRHKVAHGGYRPTQQEAHAALDAHEALRGYLFDRLVASRNKYPVAAGMYVGEAGLIRRGVWTNRIRRALSGFDAERYAKFAKFRSEIFGSRVR